MPWFGKGETLVSQLIVLKNDANGPFNTMLFWVYNVIWCTCSSICYAYLTPVTKCCRISSDGGACGGVLNKNETNKHTSYFNESLKFWTI